MDSFTHNSVLHGNSVRVYCFMLGCLESMDFCVSHTCFINFFTSSTSALYTLPVAFIRLAIWFRLFMENPDQILSSEQILSRLWDCNESYIDNNSLTVYIRRLRTKIEDNPGEPKRIVTVRGMGYKWNAVD